MEVERRASVIQLNFTLTTSRRRMTKGKETRSVPISKRMVWEAYRKEKANHGSAGVDSVSLEDFQTNLEKNLYKIWNRLSSGSYFPPPVREVEIPKKDGRKRKLGIPTVGDRIAQQVIKSYLEPRLEEVFHKSSYGYRPKRSAHQAIEQVRRHVRTNSWVIDMDIKSFFDEVDHDLLMKAVERHVDEGWVTMYIRRWLEMPVQEKTGRLRNKCLFHLKSIPGFQFKSIPLLFNYQEQERKGVPLFSPVLVGALARCFIFFISSIIL
jgi:RNA-directed DNA polymerase